MEKIFGTLIQYLSNNSVFVLLLIFVGLCLIKLGMWLKEFLSHEKRIENIEKDHGLLISVSTKVDLIYNIVNPNSTIRSGSPMSLTPKGEEISKKIHGEEIFNRIKDNFIKDFIEKSKGKNAFEIQQSAIEWAKNDLKKYISKDELEIFHKEAYNEGLLPEDVYSILGLYLREEVLSALDIATTEVDKHDPNNT